MGPSRCRRVIRLPDVQRILEDCPIRRSSSSTRLPRRGPSDNFQADGPTTETKSVDCPRCGGPGSATIEHMFAWWEELNEAQRTAVSHEGRPLRVLAGAGTGKTTVLSARVAWLLATGTPAERILLLTFTRRAARQMLDRTDVMLAAPQGHGRSDPTTSRVMGGTFHAVAHRTLRRYSQALGIPEGFSVLDPSDAADVIDLVREEGCYAQTSGQRFPRKALLLDIYSRAVNTGRSVSTVTAAVAPWATLS